MPFELNLNGLDEATVAILKSDAVQDALQAAYITASEEETKGLRTNRDSLLGEKAELARKLAELEALGGIEALRDLPKVKETAKTKTEQEASYAEQVRVLQGQLNDIKAQALNEKLTTKLHKEIRDLSGVPELLETHVRSRIRHELDANGQLKVTVLDKNGIPSIVDGKDATLKDLLSEFKGHPTLARGFDAPAINGGGTKAGATNGNGSTSNPFNKTNPNYSEQGRLVKADRNEAIRLANSAGVQIAGLNA